jgi:hypothetical protein
MLATLNVTAPPDMPCERIVAKPPTSAREAPEKPAFPWGVQLIGDRSEIKALLPSIAEEARGYPWRVPADDRPHHPEDDRSGDLDPHTHRSG